jgi:hypothetical protein
MLLRTVCVPLQPQAAHVLPCKLQPELVNIQIQISKIQCACLGMYVPKYSSLGTIFTTLD